MMSSREVKEYLSHHHLPQLLESLLTGLLYHHPDDPVSFLHSCLITTRQLGGPEAVTWDTFIHLERHQLSPRPPQTTPRPRRTTSIPPVLSLPPIKTLPPITPSITPTTPSTTFTPSTTPPKPQIIPPITPPTLSKTTPAPPVIPKIIPQTAQTSPCSIMPPTSTPLTGEHNVGPQIPSIKPKTSADHKALAPAPPGPAVTPPAPSRPAVTPPAPPGPAVTPPAPPGPAVTPPAVHLEGKEPQDTETVSTEGPPRGLPPSPVQSQLSIDSDSDMTESSGLLQEVSILPPQRPRPLIIFIIGGPGSGKGSQAARLARSFSLRVISLDELLRRQLLRHASPSRKWRVISEMMGHGELGPQEETISELRRQLIGPRQVRGFIVDGFPRDVHQALSFQEQIGSPDLVMQLLCSNETLHGRLQRRATQLGLLGDNSHALQRRLETFQRDIISIHRYYRQLHLQTQVDADRDEEMVFADLSSVIREKLLLKDSGSADIPECSSVVRSVNQ